MTMLRDILITFMSYRRKRNRRGLPSLKNILHAGSSHSAHTSGEIMYGSSEIIHKSFANLMNNKISGNYAEFGVFNGATTLEAIAASRVFGLDDLQFYIFDSFEGLPELDTKDTEEIFFKGQFSSSLDNFVKNLKKRARESCKISYFSRLLQSNST